MAFFCKINDLKKDISEKSISKNNKSIHKNSALSNQVKLQHMQQLYEYRQELRKAPQLRSLFLEMTCLCNEYCRHCGSKCNDSEGEGILSVAEIKAALDSVKEDFGTDVKLSITGGEPLLRKEFFEIMEYAHQLGFRWGMTSNGTLIDRETARRLKETGMETISVSVDGLKDNHEWFRRVPGCYDKTMEGIQNLLEVGFPHVQITTVIHHKNIHELEEMYELFHSTGIRSWRVINMEPIGRALETKELELSAEEYAVLLKFIEKKRFEDSNFPVTYGCSHYLGTELEREVRKWYFLCNAGVYTASIMYNGDVGGCLDIERRPETIQGNIRQTRFREIWKERFEIFRSDYRKTGPCKNCKDYKYCAGDSFHTWDFDKMEPRICMRELLKRQEF